MSGNLLRNRPGLIEQFILPQRLKRMMQSSLSEECLQKLGNRLNADTQRTFRLVHQATKIF